MRPVVNDRFICYLEGASASLRFSSQEEAEKARTNLLAAGLIEQESFFEYRREEPTKGEAFMEPSLRRRVPPISEEEGKFALQIPLQNTQAAQTLLAESKPELVLPEKQNAQLVFEDRYAALNAQEALVKAGMLTQEQHYTEMRKESRGGASPFEYVIEIPRNATVQALDCLKEIRGLPTKESGAGHTR